MKTRRCATRSSAVSAIAATAASLRTRPQTTAVAPPRRRRLCGHLLRLQRRQLQLRRFVPILSRPERVGFSSSSRGPTGKCYAFGDGGGDGDFPD